MNLKEKTINGLFYIEKNLIKGNKLLLMPITLIMVFVIISFGANTEALENVGHSNTKTMTGTLTSDIKRYGAAKLIKVYGPQLEEMKKQGMSNTRILDLLAIKSQECNNYDSCVGQRGVDIGPMQINQIHKEQYSHSFVLHNEKRFGELFLYQLDYANGLVQSYEDRFCGPHIFEEIGRTYTNERRAKCNFVSYNGGSNKKVYAEIVWMKREVISEFLFSEGFLTID